MPNSTPLENARQSGGWAERPSLEYQHAFDYCAAALQRAAGPIAVLASHPFYGHELAARLDPAAVTLFATPAWDLSPAEVQAWLGAEGAGRDTDLERLPGSSLSAVVWAEPESEGGRETLARVGQVIAPDGRLYVVTSSPLRRFLPEWQGEDWRPAQHPAGQRATLHWLHTAGWRIEQHYGFHGPRSVLWGLAARCAAAGRRRDWADRCLVAMRVHYVVRGWQSLLAPVSLVVARKG